MTADMKTILSLILSITAAATTAFAAQTVTGTVIDAESKTPLDFVNVVLMDADSAFVTGTVTDAEGAFTLPEPSEAASLVRFSSVGYENLTMPMDGSGSLGTVAMTPSAIRLGEVTVRSDRPVTSIRDNALVTNIEGSQLAHAGTANDVLAQIPMVLGRDGNFEVFGKGVPAVYINGRKVEDTSELSQLNSADIKSVEVITNPGAKYDASVKSVIRIRTRRRQGDGLSGTLRVQLGFRPDFVAISQANLKYRTGGWEIFGNFGYSNGLYRNDKLNEMITRGSTVWDQSITTRGRSRINDLFGKLGLSYMISDCHSLGAYYSNGYSHSNTDFSYFTDMKADGKHYDDITTDGHGHGSSVPKHHVNAYYNGEAGKLAIDFNADYIWRKKREETANDEISDNFDNAAISTTGITRSRMFAEKLVLGYPLWKGRIEAGEEYTSSRFDNDFSSDAPGVGNATARVDEKNIAGFLSIMQAIGRFQIAAGLRYEHVRFDYRENGQLRAQQSKRYDNLFPSVDIATKIKQAQLSLSYSHKTQRPSYASLDGTVDYINRFTLESGNPYLRPEKIHSVELTGAWRMLFGQLSYSYKKDPVLNTSLPYGDDGEVKLLTKSNFPHIHTLNAFVGAQFAVGAWQPKVNLGILKQWLTIDYAGSRKILSNPVGLVQWQNAIHLPGDVWLNIDMLWISRGNQENTAIKSASYLNAKVYKAFCKNRFSVSVEANDIFNKSGHDFTFYNRDVTIIQTSIANNRAFMLTLQYNFNTTRDRYKGRGAGTNELNRL